MSRSNQDPLGDLSPMPYGKHKGQMMQEIPADYLHYLWLCGKDKEIGDPVADYIRANLVALKREHKDGIW